MIVVTVARRPLSEPNVAANVLRHGCGAIDIDACRIASGGEHMVRGEVSRGTAPAGDEREGASLGWWRPGQSFVPTNHPGGRWPANVILGHLEGCQRLGTRRVQATNIHGSATAMRRSGVHEEAGGHQTVGREQPVRGYADEDGLEAVESWDCVGGCPVAALDAQVDPTRSAGGRVGNKDGGGIYGGGKGLAGDFNAGDPGYGDVGGPSRYFLQVRR